MDRFEITGYQGTGNAMAVIAGITERSLCMCNR